MKHYNSKIVSKVSDIFKAKGQPMPDEVMETIQPVYDMTPNSDYIIQGGGVNSTSTIIATFPAGRDFMLTGINYSMRKTAACTATWMRVTATINGVNTALAYIPTIPSVAAAENQVLMFPSPIKLTQGTSVYGGMENASADSVFYVTLYGFYVE